MYTYLGIYPTFEHIEILKTRVTDLELIKQFDIPLDLSINNAVEFVCRKMLNLGFKPTSSINPSKDSYSQKYLSKAKYEYRNHPARALRKSIDACQLPSIITPNILSEVSPVAVIETPVPLNLQNSESTILPSITVGKLIGKKKQKLRKNKRLSM